MKKTGIAAMMLFDGDCSYQHRCTGLCSGRDRQAESAQVQEQPQTETEPAKSISDEDFAKLLGFCKRKVGRRRAG